MGKQCQSGLSLFSSFEQWEKANTIIVILFVIPLFKRGNEAHACLALLTHTTPLVAAWCSSLVLNIIIVCCPPQLSDRSVKLVAEVHPLRPGQLPLSVIGRARL